MASVGISIPREPVTSPVSPNKTAFNVSDRQQFGAFSRRSSTQSSQSDRAAASQRLMRKRSWSFHTDWKGLKRRRKGIVPPTKFLLGGNICDPLNLGSLNDEEANRIANANTPVSSPMPTPKYRKERIEVIIPPDISDPLGLNGPEAGAGPDSLVSPTAQRKKRNKRKKKQPSGHGADRSFSEPLSRTQSECTSRSVSEGGEPSTTAPTELEFAPCLDPTAPSSAAPPEAPAAAGPAAGAARPGRQHGRKLAAEIVSPAVPQPGGRALFPRAAARGADGPKPPPQHAPTFRPRDAAFQYGNYNRYYGYRNTDQQDSRLGWLKREWFSGLDVLDVGCNIGHITLTVARDYLPRRCVGIDIDDSLVKMARKNVKHYERAGEFPVSMPLLYGGLAPPHKAPGSQFPHNVSFVHANYVLESDELLETVRPEFDTILCLSITKWVHLNFGDAGIRRFFRRAFLSLRPGGRLLLEPQPWPSYVKKKKTTARIWENFHEIRLRPETFPDLLINEIGFEGYKTVGRPHHSAKGFSRQLQLFTKAGERTSDGETASSAPPSPAAERSADVQMTETGGGEPSPAAGGGGEPSPAAEGGGQPSPAAEGGREPSPAAGGGGEPSPAAGGGGEPSPAAGGGGEPSPAAEGGGEPSPAAEGGGCRPAGP